MKNTRIIFMLAALGLVASAQPKHNTAPGQRFFNLEDAVQHPEQLSDAELAALANDDLTRKELGTVSSGSALTPLTQEGLEATTVHLCGSGERDLVVIGDGAPFVGANVGPFWIIRDLPTGPVVVLGEISLGLTIETKRSNKCLGVEAFTATAADGTTTDYSFNGSRYIVSKQKSAKLAQ
jgi:hypothetical protein